MKETKSPILLIDDEKRMVDSMQFLLVQSGYKVEVAYSGRQGLSKIEHNHYDVVVTDLKMPEVDGEQIIKYIRDNNVESMIVVITGHASTESAIEAVHYNVYEYITKPFEFERLEAAVAGALARLKTNRMRNDMIDMITHDIKVPLNSILGYSSMIFDKNNERLHPQAMSFVNTITSNVHKILALVDNFLTSCKVEAGRLLLCVRDINLNDLFNDIITCLSPDVEKKQLTLKVTLLEEPPPLRGDDNLLYRALANLLSNAVKYSAVGKEIVLKCPSVKREHSPLKKRAVKIVVANQGTKIPEGDLPFLFEKFHRGHPVPYEKGTGLGLYVLKSIINAHHGIVEVHSSSEATVFTVYLPLEN